MQVDKEDWHTKNLNKRHTKSFNTSLNKIDRWKAYVHYELSHPDIRHKRGQKLLRKQKRHTSRKYRRSVRDTDFRNGGVENLPTKDGFLFAKENGPDTSTFIDMNNGYDVDITENEFQKYHSEFSRNEKRWEVNPREKVMEYIDELYGDSERTIKVGDYGCGNAEIESYFEFHKNIEVKSYDLHQLHPTVIVADMNDMSCVEDGEFDIIVMCLSLMKRIRKKLSEADRTLRKGGDILIWQPRSQKKELNEAIEDSEFKIKKTINTEKFIFHHITK